MPRLTLALALCLLASAQTRAMELGQTKEAIRTQHGVATEEHHGKNTAVYRSGPWKVDIQFCQEIACQLTFTRLGQLTEEEIQSILQQNAGGGSWHEMQTDDPAKRAWQRSDFASAECLRDKPRSITFNTAPPEPEPTATVALAEDTADDTPVPYSVEQASTPVPAAKPPQPNMNWQEMLMNATRFIADHLLMVVIPVIILIVIGLSKAGRRPQKKKAAEAEPARRVIAPAPRSAEPEAKRPPGAIATNVDGLEADEFELLVGEMFRRRGYEVEISGGLGMDGGKDLTLRKGPETVLVQCRQWNEWKVSEPPVREFHSQILEEGAKGGIFVTSGSYTPDAIAFAKGKAIRLLGRPELDAILKELSEPNENMCDLRSWIDRFASTARVVDPKCPFCSEPMKLKRSVQGKAFWSCQSFPKCAGQRAGRAQLLKTREA